MAIIVMGQVITEGNGNKTGGRKNKSIPQTICYYIVTQLLQYYMQK